MNDDEGAESFSLDVPLTHAFSPEDWRRCELMEERLRFYGMYTIEDGPQGRSYFVVYPVDVICDSLPGYGSRLQLTAAWVKAHKGRIQLRLDTCAHCGAVFRDHAESTLRCVLLPSRWQAAGRPKKEDTEAQ